MGLTDNLDAYDKAILRLGPAHHWRLMDADLSDKVPPGQDMVNAGSVPLTYPGPPTLSPVGVLAPAVPHFTQVTTQYFHAPTSTIYGKSSWVVVAWALADYAVLSEDTTTKTLTLYSERGSGGNSGIAIEWSGFKPSGSTVVQYTTKSDSAGLNTFASATSTGSSGRKYQMIVIVRTATNHRIYVDGQPNSAPSSTAVLPIMTDATSLETWVGLNRLSGGTNPFKGTVFRVSAFGSAARFLNSDGTFNDKLVADLYEIGYPEAPVADPYHPVSLPSMWKAKSIFKQRLPNDWTPDPSVSQMALASAMTALQGRVTAPTIGSSGSSVPKIYHIKEGTTPDSLYDIVRVIQPGGRYANVKTDKEGIWQAAGTVPLPVDAYGGGYVPEDDDHLGLGGRQQLAGNDLYCCVFYEKLTGQIQYHEMWHLYKGLGFSTIDRSGQNTVVNASGSGSIPAGTGLGFGLVFANANGLGWGYPKAGGGTTNLDGTQSVTLTINKIAENPGDYGDSFGWTQLVAIETRDSGNTYHVIQRWTLGGDIPFPTVINQATSTITVTVDNYNNEGVDIPYQNGFMPASGATSSVFSCGTYGFVPDIRQSKGYFDSVGVGGLTHTDWGGTASRIPKAGGAILAKECLAGLIEHALVFNISKALPNGTGFTNTFVYPAHSTDNALAPLKQGMRVAFPPGTYDKFFAAVAPFDPTTLGYDTRTIAWNSTFKAVFRALEQYGAYPIDSTSDGFIFQGEEDTFHGASPWAAIPAAPTGFGLGKIPLSSLSVVPVSVTHDYVES